MKASIARLIIVLGHSSNGSEEQPAIITRAWSEQDTKDGPVLVNATVLPDCSEPVVQGSIKLFDSRDEAVAYRTGATLPEKVAFWPPRV